MLTKEDLIHTTAKILVTKNDGTGSLATGFFYKSCNNQQENYFIVSNKHVLNDIIHMDFCVPVKTKDGILPSMIGNDLSSVLHPEYDLGYVCINSIIDLCKKSNPMDVTFITKEDIINDISLFSLIENALVLGYPLCLQSNSFSYPIIRSGVVATSLQNKFTNKEEFLTDIQCFHGSSGSPVFVSYDNRYYVAGIQHAIYKTYAHTKENEKKEIDTGMSRCVNYNILTSFLP